VRGKTATFDEKRKKAKKEETTDLLKERMAADDFIQ